MHEDGRMGDGTSCMGKGRAAFRSIEGHGTSQTERTCNILDHETRQPVFLTPCNKFSLAAFSTSRSAGTPLLCKTSMKKHERQDNGDRGWPKSTQGTCTCTYTCQLLKVHAPLSAEPYSSSGRLKALTLSLFSCWVAPASHITPPLHDNHAACTHGNGW